MASPTARLICRFNKVQFAIIIVMNTLVALGTAGPKLDPERLKAKQEKLFSFLKDLGQGNCGIFGGH